MRRYLGQLLLVLGKNILLRWRNPVLLCLELAWPILIFSLLGIIRQATLPVGSETCHYAPIGLPSAGLVPLIQSMLCGAGSSCLNASQASRLVSAPINRYEQRLRPLKDDPGAPRALRQIPSTLSLFARLHRGLEDPELSSLLSGNLSLEHFVMDPEGLRGAVSGFLRHPAFNALLHSSLNLSQVKKHFFGPRPLPLSFCRLEGFRVPGFLCQPLRDGGGWRKWNERT